MKNPWKSVLLSTYEAHMALSNVQQLQTLNEITREQLHQYPVNSIAILGVAGGNGLEHVNQRQIKKVYGIDINQDYLDACKTRYKNLNGCLELIHTDLSDCTVLLPKADLIIANLLIEYIGVDTFINHIKQLKPRYVTCVIQQNQDITFVSNSPYPNDLADISKLHTDIEKSLLICSMKSANAKLVLEKKYLLPNGKKFIRLDFAMVIKTHQSL